MAWQRKKAVMPIGMLVACGAVWILVEEFVLTGTLGTTRMMTNAVWTADANLPYYFDNNLSHRAYDSMIGNYFSYPIWQKALLLPVSMATQFLTPFPWNFARDTIYGPTLAYAHLAYPWYALGGLTIYFFGFCLRKADKAVLKWATWGLVAWSIPAFLYAGTISRYSLCFVPLLVPIAVYVVAECARLKSFKRWSAAYCVLLTVALISCHYIQSNAL